MNSQRIGALTGVLFVILVIVAFAVSGETPDADDSTRKIVSYYIDNDDEQMIAAGLLGWASVALLFFLGSLRKALRRATGDDGGLSVIVMLGGAFIAVGATIFAGLTFTLGDAAEDMPIDAVVALNGLNSDMFFTLAAGVATFNLALGLAILRHRVFPKALGILAIVVGIAGLTPLGFFAFLVTGIVIIWVSVLLAMQAGSAPEPSSVPSSL
jgi:hypothetical protein